MNWASDGPKARAIERHFEENFLSRGEVGASVSIWRNGREVLSLHAGETDRPGKGQTWTADTIVPVWSATKGPAAASVLLALHEAGRHIDDPIAEIWPELRAGREQPELSMGALLSHQGGLAVLDRRGEISVEDYAAVITALEQQAPGWRPGEGHGYHPRTFGFLVEELVRRLSGSTSLGEYWRERIAGPLGLDFWIGLPPSEDSRVARLLPGRMPASAPDEQRDFYQAFGNPGSLTRAAFASPSGLNAVGDLNHPSAWRLGLPALGGVGSARSLGKFYAVLASGGIWNGERHFPEAVLEWMKEPQITGPDKVLRMQTAFAAGFKKDPLDESGAKLRHLFGPGKEAFGHPGAGGSHGFADPETGFSFAYVMNQMELGVFPSEKALGMVRALFCEDTQMRG